MSGGNRSDTVPAFFHELWRLALAGLESMSNNTALTFVCSRGQPHRRGLKHEKCTIFTSTATWTPATSGQDVERILDNDRFFTLPRRENKKVHVVALLRDGRAKKRASFCSPVAEEQKSAHHFDFPSRENEMLHVFSFFRDGKLKSVQYACPSACRNKNRL